MRKWLKKLVVFLLTLEARAILRKYNPKIVAVTGSVGKTSTKDAIFAVVAQKYHVRKSEKSFNSEVGLPLTILGLENAWGNPLRWFQNIFDGLLLILFSAQYPEWLVLEVGADRPGDISSLRGWLRSEIVVITRLPEVPVHVEFFGSVEEVVEEKASLIDTLRSGGSLVLYGDDERTLRLQERLPAPDAKVVTFGFSDEADVRGGHFKFLYEEGAQTWPLGMQGQITAAGESAPVEVVGTLGAHTFLPLVAAAAVGTALGMPLLEIAQGLAGYQAPPGRMRLLPGIKDTFVIDDTYNASPAAVQAALETLGEIKTNGRRVAVLGDMLELGRHSVEEHKKLGALVAKTCDMLLTVGFRMRDTANTALDAGMLDKDILQYEDSEKAGAELQNLLREGDLVLVKGSQSTRMERVVKEIMTEPDRAKELLVRQDREWKKR